MQALKILYLQDNKLESLPPSFSNLRALEVLNLSFNALTVIPFPIILDMTALQVLMTPGVVFGCQFFRHAL